LSRILQDALTGLKHPQAVHIFMCTFYVKMTTVVGAINRFIPSGYVQSACRMSLESKFTSLGLGLETFGIGLEDLCPWLRRLVALA